MKHILIVLLTLVFVITLTGCTSPIKKQDDKGYTNVVENSDISIPGYESIDFKAGKKKQSSKFHNPENNSCYFVMTLIMDDETLWKSDYIKPGESINKIKLSRSLEAGEYSAKLKYECFTLNDKNPLNGADITLMINVS